MILIRKFLFIFIFISTITLADDNKYYWNDIGKSLHELLDKMGVPDDIEYQTNINSYLLAYDFGDIAVIYVTKENIISNIIYMQTNLDDKIIAKSFIKEYNFSMESGFKMSVVGVGYFVAERQNIILTGNITKMKNEFVLTVLVSRKD